MESKTLDSVLRTTEAERNPRTEMPAQDRGNREAKMNEANESKEAAPKKKYDAVSKNGDTLELSEDGKKMGERADAAQEGRPAKTVISDSGKKISDSTLTGYSVAKLKQMYANKEISKQQYERIMKKKRNR